MLRSRRLAFAFITLLGSCLVSVAQQVSQDEIERRVDPLLQQMTLEEKAGQLAQFAGKSPQTMEMIRQGKVGSLLGVLGAKENNGRRSNTHA
jgi:beta-glucosidase